ncbi:MAG: Tyrosine recombinase XerC [Chloroflexi bacterium ADurb.Bin360]|nr:MAG: Tyrosine recombinase XerC [Chloroflexi bacterium ADurb.Bin360]
MKPLRLSQAVRGFLMEKEATGKSQYTLRNYRYSFAKVKTFLEECHQGIDPYLNEIERDLWVEFLVWVQHRPCGGAVPRDKELSAKSVCNVYIDLSALYTWAVKLEFVSKHLIKTIEQPEFEKAVVDPFTKEEMQRMLKACDYSLPWRGREFKRTRRPTATRDKAIILLLLSSGIRASELCGIKIADLDMKTRKLLVRGKGRGKDSKERIVPFGTRTQRALWRYMIEFEEDRPETARLFVVDLTNPRQMGRGALLHMLLAVGQRAGVPNVYAHRFRHTFAINYLRNGGDLLTLQAILGHRDLRMVRHYAKVAAEDCAAVHLRVDPVDTWAL